jgi:hypothetical protein
MFGNVRERVCWAFAFCHMCGTHKATDRCEVVALEKGVGATVMMCRDCFVCHSASYGKYVKQIVGGSIVASPRHFDTQSEMQAVADNISAMESCIVLVARQCWLKGKWKLKDAPRTARRSIPFPDGGHRAPKIVWTGGTVPNPKTVKVTEICVCLRVFDSPQLEFRTSIETRHLETFRKASSKEIVKRLLVKGTLRYQSRIKLLNDLKTPFSYSVPHSPARRKGTRPWHLPRRECTHCHGEASLRLWLRSCSLCNECDVVAEC